MCLTSRTFPGTAAYSIKLTTDSRPRVRVRYSDQEDRGPFSSQRDWHSDFAIGTDHEFENATKAFKAVCTALDAPVGRLVFRSCNCRVRADPTETCPPGL